MFVCVHREGVSDFVLAVTDHFCFSAICLCCVRFFVFFLILLFDRHGASRTSSRRHVPDMFLGDARPYCKHLVICNAYMHVGMLCVCNVFLLFLARSGSCAATNSALNVLAGGELLVRVVFPIALVCLFVCLSVFLCLCDVLLARRGDMPPVPRTHPPGGG